MPSEGPTSGIEGTRRVCWRWSLLSRLKVGVRCSYSLPCFCFLSGQILSRQDERRTGRSCCSSQATAVSTSGREPGARRGQKKSLRATRPFGRPTQQEVVNSSSRALAHQLSLHIARVGCVLVAGRATGQDWWTARGSTNRKLYQLLILADSSRAEEGRSATSVTSTVGVLGGQESAVTAHKEASPSSTGSLLSLQLGRSRFQRPQSALGNTRQQTKLSERALRVREPEC